VRDRWAILVISESVLLRELTKNTTGRIAAIKIPQKSKIFLYEKEAFGVIVG